eukprot:CAMPEP_0197591028 /NCGR_PEP_ID=MMETSP1326-20131121/12563_1 /TAXON_ID=1155430 /ORGANISM="Genus nov. species nov., Strain RCC2288" /LENGTH=308 /DNA_ID=CAMNT_0043156361 /DNA_START=66 /DNA_END=992 /DNA_ORIENTATION=+
MELSMMSASAAQASLMRSGLLGSGGNAACSTGRGPTSARNGRTRSSSKRRDESEVATCPPVGDADTMDTDHRQSMELPRGSTGGVNEFGSASRRSTIFGGFTTAAAGLAATIAANVVLPLGVRAAEPVANKIVAVPYTPYQVLSDSSEESLEVAKALKAAGARLYGAFWCENCNKQKELLGKQAMEYVTYVECFPQGVYQNAPGHENVTKPDQICTGYTSAWPLWVVPKDGSAAEGRDEIGIQGQIKKPKDLMRLVKEAKGEKFDPLNYFTTGGDGYTGNGAAADAAAAVDTPVAAADGVAVDMEMAM